MKFSFPTIVIGSLFLLSIFCSAVAAADNDNHESLRGSNQHAAQRSSSGSRELQDCPPNGFWDAPNNKCSCQSWDVWTGDACCPPNGYYDWSAGWCSCQSWDVWTGDACCPANAYFDWSAGQCTCISDYQWDGSACISTPPPPNQGLVNPVTGCEGGGGACGCGLGGDGGQISMNRFWGNDNDEQVFGCGGAFALDGATWDAQWGGTLSESGPEASVMQSVGLTFSQSASYDGWEGCCLICGVNLELTGKISTGWYCEKDFFSTGIWLKGVNKQ